MDNETNVPASKNILLTIILILLILITGAMIFNFYGMSIQSETSNIPKCVGSDDLMLDTVPKASNSDNESESRVFRLGKLLAEKVGDYRDGSYHPEIQKEMIKRAQEDVRKKVLAKAEEKIAALDEKKISTSSEKKSETKPKVESITTPQKVETMVSSQKLEQPGPKSDKPVQGKTKLCIYHMQGCGHCHDIMSDKQQNGMTKFEQLKKLFSDKPEIEILDFQHGRDSEASKYGAFPVIMLIKSDGSSTEYNRERSVEGMARFIIQNA